MKSNDFYVEEEDRLDKILTRRFPNYSRSYFQTLIEKMCVKVNGLPAKKRDIPKIRDKISITFFPKEKIKLKAQNIPLNILYEDASILCINKPAGMVVHPAPGNPDNTFVNALLFHCKMLPFSKDDCRPGIVHRLDKNTSGILIAAKNSKAHQNLITLFETHQVKKKYLALCIGNPGNLEIISPIGRHPIHRKKMTTTEKGKSAITHICTLKKGSLFSLVQATPITGRTHQIRVHLSSKGFAILGDETYGSAKINQKFGAVRQFLHAHTLSLPHPTEKKTLLFKAPLPEDMEKAIHSLLPP